MAPEAKGAAAFSGAVYSSIAGLVLGAVLVAVGKFAVKDGLGQSILFVCAVAVFLLLTAVGLFQPLLDRYRARRYRSRALRVAESGVWFGAGGIYHEALGYTSAKNLARVHDRTKTLGTIGFVVRVATVLGAEGVSAETEHLQLKSFAVPRGCEAQAVRLAHRYREDRLRG